MSEPATPILAAAGLFRPPPAALALPFAGEPADFGLPLLLVVLAALAGGLRALLASPVRRSLLEALPAARRQELEESWTRRPGLAATAGLLRALLLFAAVVVLVESLPGDASLAADLVSWGAFGLVAAFLVEGIPTLVQQGRGLGLVLLLHPLVRVLEPPLRPLTRLLAALVRGLGGAPLGAGPGRLAADLIEVAAELLKDEGRPDRLTPVEKRMIARILRMGSVDAAAVMTPRTRITAVPAEATVAEALRLAHQEGHSRLPVFEEDIDHLIGVFHVKDALEHAAAGNGASSRVREFLRPVLYTPETTLLFPLLENMRRERTHLSVVVDEYGVTAGVVTIEDIVEEIVGEISDEHDLQDEDLVLDRPGPDEILVDARMSVADLNRTFGGELPEDEDFDTVGGLLCERCGAIPEPGERVQVDGLVLEVEEADDRRVRRVRIHRLPPEASDAA